MSVFTSSAKPLGCLQVWMCGCKERALDLPQLLNAEVDRLGWVSLPYDVVMTCTRISENAWPLESLHRSAEC